MGHKELCDDLIHFIAEANGPKVIERFQTIAFRNEGD